MSIMFWSECEICGEVLHRWGILWPHWVHGRQKARRKPLHPDGWKDYDHKARPTDKVSIFPPRPGE